jgi:hypothetical protein
MDKRYRNNGIKATTQANSEACFKSRDTDIVWTITFCLIAQKFLYTPNTQAHSQAFYGWTAIQNVAGVPALQSVPLYSYLSQLLLKSSVHAQSRWIGLVIQMQTTLQDAGCHCLYQTMGKSSTEKETIYKSLNSTSIFMLVITKTDCIAAYCCENFRSHV